MLYSRHPYIPLLWVRFIIGRASSTLCPGCFQYIFQVWYLSGLFDFSLLFYRNFFSFLAKSCSRDSFLLSSGTRIVRVVVRSLNYNFLFLLFRSIWIEIPNSTSGKLRVICYKLNIYLHHILPPVPISIVIRSIVWVILLFHNWLPRSFLGTLEMEKRKNADAQKHEKNADDADSDGGCKSRATSKCLWGLILGIQVFHHIYLECKLVWCRRILSPASCRQYQPSLWWMSSCQGREHSSHRLRL